MTCVTCIVFTVVVFSHRYLSGVREILCGILQREGKGREKLARVTCKTIIYDLCYLCSGVILVVFSPWYLSGVRETLYGLV